MDRQIDEILTELEAESKQLTGRLRGVDHLVKWLRAYRTRMIDANGFLLVLSRLMSSAKSRQEEEEGEVYTKVYHALYEKRRVS